MHVLICDTIDDEAIELLSHDDILLDYKPDITADQLSLIVSDVDGLIVRSRTKITAEIIRKASKLRVIGRVGTGVDTIDCAAAKERNISIVNAPDANAPAVAEFTVGVMISLLRNLIPAHLGMREGKWEKQLLIGQELSSQTVGIVGHGNIGKRVETLVGLFGASVQIFSRSERTCSLEELFSTSTIITLHVPLTETTKGLVSLSLIERMRKDAIFINTSRYDCVDNNALYNALSVRAIRCAALDVFDIEPLPKDSKWRMLSNVYLTPHIAAATEESLKRASRIVAQDVAIVLRGGTPYNRVNY